MLPHHQLTLDKASAYFQGDPTVLALCLGGSIAKGAAKPTSDVDVIVVVTAEEFARRRRERAYAAVYREFADYEGGYVDAKFVDEGFLAAAAEKGSEPTRDSFVGIRLVGSKVDGIEDLLARIPVYPEAEREEKIRRFYSSALIQRFFIQEAEKRGDPFLLAYAASQRVLFAGRLILAHNRVLFPSNKRLIERVASVDEQPEGFIEALTNLAQHPSSGTAQTVMDLVNNFRNWGIDWATALGQYVEDSEFNWLDNPPPLAES